MKAKAVHPANLHVWVCETLHKQHAHAFCRPFERPFTRPPDFPFPHPFACRLLKLHNDIFQCVRILLLQLGALLLTTDIFLSAAVSWLLLLPSLHGCWYRRSCRHCFCCFCCFVLAGNVDNCFATFAVIEKMYSNSLPRLGVRVQQNVNTGLIARRFVYSAE